MQHARIFIIFFGVLIAVAAWTACGGGDPDPTPEPSLSTPTVEAAADASPPAGPAMSDADIEDAVREALDQEGADIAFDDVELPSGVDPDSVRDRVEDEIARALEEFETDAEAVASDATDEEEESDPDVLFRYMNAVNTLYAGQNEESLTAFDLIIRVHPEMPRAYYYRGVANYRSELNDQAMDDFDRSIELDPESGDTYLQRGLLHYDLGDEQAALKDFNTAIDLFPWLADAYRNRGALLINNSQVAPGRADLERALEIYRFERNQERVEEVTELLNGPLTGPIEMFKATDILPRLP